MSTEGERNKVYRMNQATGAAFNKEAHMNDYLEFVPTQFPEGYTMRAERIRQWIKGIVFIALIVFVMGVLIYGTP